MKLRNTAAVLGALALGAIGSAQAGPQIFVQMGTSTSPAGGDPNVITDTSAFEVGVAGGNFTLQDPLLIVVGVYNDMGVPSISFSGCATPAACPMAPTTGVDYGLSANNVSLTSSSPHDAFGMLGLSTHGDNSESWHTWSAYDSSIGLSPTSFTLYAFELDTNLMSGSPITIDESGAANGSFIAAFDCRGTGAAGSSCSQGDLAKTVFTNTGAISVTTTTVPEPATLALFAAGLAGLGFALRRRSMKV